MRRLIFIFLTIFCIAEKQADSQQLWGVVNSNYAGINATMINPSRMVDSKWWLDINILTFDAFGENNSLFLPKEELFFLEILSPAADYGDQNPVLLDSYSKQRTFKANFNTRIEFPSIMLNLGENAFGFQWSVRGAGSVRGVEYHTSKFMYEGIDFDPQQDQYFELRNMKTSALAWAEYSLSYARVFNQFLDSRWAFGASLKKLQGLGGAFFNVPYANYIVYDDSTLAVEELSGDFAYSMPIDYGSSDYTSQYGTSLGNGWAVDLGINYQKMRDGNGLVKFQMPCEQKWSSYKYKIGVSILDLGAIRMKDNAASYHFDQAQTYWPGFDRFDPQSIEAFSAEFNSRFGHSIAPDAERFSIGLPTVASVQVDIHPSGYWFFNTSLIYPTPIFRNSIVAPTQLSFTPRYEKRRFEIAFPLSVYEWSRLRFGVAARFLNITVGTDYFSSWTGWFDFYGSDIYFSWKKSFAKGSCKHGRSEFHKGKRFYKNACPDF